MSDPAAGEQLLPGGLLRSSSSTRLNAQAPEFAPRPPAALGVFAGPPPLPETSPIAAGPRSPPKQKAGLEQAPRQQEGKGRVLNPKDLLHRMDRGSEKDGCYVKLYRGFNIAPIPLDQGSDGTCNFFAVAKGTQMQIHKHYVDNEVQCDIITYPNATVDDYCALKNIRKCEINNPEKDWPKEVRARKIEWLGKTKGIEAVSGQWANPKRIKLDGLVFHGERIGHSRLADLLSTGNPLMCQIIAGPGFEKLGPNEVWSCRGRFIKNETLRHPYYYHVVVLVDCKGPEDPVRFLNSGGRGFGNLGYGFTTLRDVRWVYGFKVSYPLTFVNVPGHSSCQTWRFDKGATSSAQRISCSPATMSLMKATSESSSSNNSKMFVTVPGRSSGQTCRFDKSGQRWRPDTAPSVQTVNGSCRTADGATSSYVSKGKEIINEKPRGSSMSSQSHLGINAPKWGRNSFAATASPRQSQLVIRDRSGIDAPRWCQNNVPASGINASRWSTSSSGKMPERTQVPSSSWQHLSAPVCQPLVKAASQSSSSSSSSNSKMSDGRHNVVNLNSAHSHLSCPVAEQSAVLDVNRIVRLTQHPPLP